MKLSIAAIAIFFTSSIFGFSVITTPNSNQKVVGTPPFLKTSRLFMGDKNWVKDEVEEAKDGWEDNVDRAQEKGEALKEDVKDGLGIEHEEGESLWQETKGVVSSTWDKTKDVASTVKDKTKGVVSTGWQKTKDFVTSDED